MVFDVIAEEHLAIFYPLPYFELEIINNVLFRQVENIPNASKIYLDLSFHWICLKQFSDRDFCENYITAFDQQVIASSAQRLVGNLIGDQNKSVGYKYPDYAVITCNRGSSQDAVQITHQAELLFMGQLIDSQERWEFYEAENFERPCQDELRHLKGIVIPSSNFQIKNKGPRDDNIIKQYVKRQNERTQSNGGQSEIDGRSSIGSTDAY